MAFTNDLTTAIGQVRLECWDDDPNNYMFQDEAINYFLSKANGDVEGAACQALKVKHRKLALNPTSKNTGGYSHTYDLAKLENAIKMLEDSLTARGLALDGTDLAQFGFIEVGRDKHSENEVEFNKAARGE